MPTGAPAFADAADTLNGLVTRYGYVRISAFNSKENVAEAIQRITRAF